MRKKEYDLTPDQKEAFSIFQQDRNIFLTGKAGTGKSYLANYISDFCEKNHMNIIKCAPTGLAAQNIGGSTIHRIFHVPMGPVVKKPKKAPEVIVNTDILLIDEISLCRVDVFEWVIRTIQLANKERKYPIQLVLVGDFSQIAPVMTKQEKEVLSSFYGSDIGGGYCFRSPLWKEYEIETISLTTIVRQKDKEFCAALDKARDGDADCIPYILSHSSERPLEDAIWIYSRNRDVDKCNNESLAKLRGEEYLFTTEYYGGVKASDFSFGDTLTLKVGARILVTANGTDSSGTNYYNGDTGAIKKIQRDGSKILVSLDDGAEIRMEKQEFPIYTYEMKQDLNGQVRVAKTKVGYAVQFPLKLGYAATVHKSQGQTFEKLNFSPDCFEAGQFYVAVSRCKSIENLYIKGRSITKKSIIASQEVKKFMEQGATNLSPEEIRMVTMQIPAAYEQKVKEFVAELQKQDKAPVNYEDIISCASVRSKSSDDSGAAW